ncbi:hypothetical protein DFH29DRAFT_231130 [Suillus ampliporus]|nr:hypothetical protein DFH29DRAFT_231130 [Suillus ampliporus]
MPTVKHTPTAVLACLSSVLPARMPSNTYYPPGGLSNANHPPITHNQLCISLSDPNLVAAEARLSKMACQREQQQAVNSIYQRDRDARTLKADGADRRAAEDLQDLRQGAHAKFDPLETLKSASQSHDVKTVMRYLAKIRSVCTVAFGKPGSLSTGVCAPPSYVLLSDALETIKSIHSLKLATSGADDTFFTVDEYIHVFNLPPLASEAFREELYILGYIKRPDQEDRPLRWPRRIFVPRLFRALYNRCRKQVAAVPVSSRSPQHQSPKAIGRRGGLTVAEALKSANIEEDPRAPTPARLSPTDQSIYWSCKSPQTSPDSSTSPSVQESPLSISQSCEFCEFSYVTSHTTPPSSPELAGLKEKGVLGTMSSFSEVALRSLAPRACVDEGEVFVYGGGCEEFSKVAVWGSLLPPSCLILVTLFIRAWMIYVFVLYTFHFGLTCRLHVSIPSHDNYT